MQCRAHFCYDNLVMIKVDHLLAWDNISLTGQEEKKWGWQLPFFQRATKQDRVFALYSVCHISGNLKELCHEDFADFRSKLS